MNKLWSSTAALYRRFNISPSFHNAKNGILEETQELIEAADVYLEYCTEQDQPPLRPWLGTTFVNLDIPAEYLEKQSLLLEAIAQEAADSIVTIFSMLMACGIQLSELEVAIQQVIEKNGNKTFRTHRVNADGKIARREDIKVYTLDDFKALLPEVYEFNVFRDKTHVMISIKKYNREYLRIVWFASGGATVTLFEDYRATSGKVLAHAVGFETLEALDLLNQIDLKAQRKRLYDEYIRSKGW